MKKIIILFCCFILISNFVIAQQLGKKDDNKNPLNQQQNLNIQTPKIDFTNMDILKQIEPSSSTNMLYNDQLLEGPINADYKKIGEPIIAIDTVGAGAGEYIYYITASEAVIPLPVDFAPVDASIVGIIDSINILK